MLHVHSFDACHRSLPRRTCKVRLSLASFATLAFPACPIGRLPRHTFRGLVERSLALWPASSRDHQVILSIEGSDEFVASSAASIATGQATLPRRDFHPLEYTRIHGARTGPYFRPRSIGEMRFSPKNGPVPNQAVNGYQVSTAENQADSCPAPPSAGASPEPLLTSPSGSLLCLRRLGEECLPLGALLFGEEFPCLTPRLVE